MASELIGDKMGGWTKVVGCVEICKVDGMVKNSLVLKFFFAIQ